MEKTKNENYQIPEEVTEEKAAIILDTIYRNS